MHASDERTAEAQREQVEILEDLVRRARAKGIHTGIRNDEIQDLTQVQAAELIEQLRQTLGDARG